MHDFRIGTLGAKTQTYPAYSCVNYLYHQTNIWRVCIYGNEGVAKGMYILAMHERHLPILIVETDIWISIEVNYRDACPESFRITANYLSS